MLRELLACDPSVPVEWDDVPSKLCGDCASLGQGLYTFVFLNESDNAVYDNNRKPKIVVHRQGASVKPGKFEQTFAVRVHNYNAHLHWQGHDGGRRRALRQCFAGGYVLDLSPMIKHVPTPARIFERYWTEAVNLFLSKRGLLADDVDQLGRAEWRYIQRSRWTAAVHRDLRSYLEGVAGRIERMAAAGRFPADPME